MYPPSPMSKIVNKREKNRFYKFHNTHGRTTTQFLNLKNIRGFGEESVPG